MSKSEPFKGVIGRTHTESTPWWPEPKRTVDDSPNVVTILFDDTGFSHFGCYGSTIETPNIDRLAAGGLRYTNFHTTALCSPTRACLMTGRNHHTVGMRMIANANTGFPNTRGNISHHAATIGEMLREEDYATLCVGKWHLAQAQDTSAAGPFDHWPVQRGYDRYYGFLDGETDQFYPSLIYDNHHVEPPCGPEDGYHLTEDLIDKSMEFIRDLKSNRPDRPYLLNLSFGATHAPHQAPPEFIEKYRGRFDAGWDVIREEWYQRQLSMGIIPEGTELAPRNRGVRPWDELSENEQKFAIRLQEAFAGFLDHTDHHIGRLISFLEDIGDLDNTIIFLLSDNGASQEGTSTGLMDGSRYFAGVMGEDVDGIQSRLDDIGGPHSHTNYPWGWAQVGNTPLKRYKQNTFGGGVRDPLIIHYPAKIKERGGIRQQFHHVNDIVPTILELLNIEPREIYNDYNQIPIAGISMMYTWDNPDEKSRKGPQYFEMFGHRGIWADGWKAVAHHKRRTPFDDEEWELYHLDEDFSECHNLAGEKPEKLREMIDLWWTEAGKNGVLPLDDRTAGLFNVGRFRPGSQSARSHYVYYPPISQVPNNVTPGMGLRDWLMTAEIERPDASTNGVLVASGTQNTGFSWYIKDGKMMFDDNNYTEHHVVSSDQEVPVGSSTLGVLFTWRDQKGTITLLINGVECGSMGVPTAIRGGSSGMSIGLDSLSPVTDDYQAPFPFTGKITKVEVNLEPFKSASDEHEDAKAKFNAEMSRQ
jgi:arylsulfatase A-like enzyme